MKRVKKILAFLLVFVMTFGSFAGVVSAATGTRPANGMTEGQPFISGVTGESANFRIPAMVTLDDGTIVAAADARWNTERDGGGLDTLVSYSEDNGATWNYTMANYLGDNGNAHNTSSSAFIDPILLTDGEVVYMVVDLWPAGYALNGANQQPPQNAENGFDANGKLRLSGDNRSSYGYYLEKNSDVNAESYYLIKNSSGNVVSGYTVDAYYNIKGASVDTNLFLADSPYKVYPTDYLYMTKSEDGGKTWGAPALLDVKKNGEQSYLVGPGAGIVTKEGTIIIPCYVYDAGYERSSFIYSTDDGATWKRTADATGITSSEAQVVELEDGTLRTFFRNTTGKLCYVDAVWNAANSAYEWKPVVTTDVVTSSYTQLSAIAYSKRVDGKEAILVSCPTGPNEAGATSSAIGSRRNGKIFVGLVQDDGSMEWPYSMSVTSNEDYFLYSCMAELEDGSVGILYEPSMREVTYARYTMEQIAPEATVGGIWITDSGEKVVKSVVVKPNESVTLSVEGTISGELQAVSDDATIASVNVSENTISITGKDVASFGQTEVEVTDGTYTISVKVYVVEAEQYEIVELRTGDAKTYFDKTGNYANADLSSVDKNIAEVTVTGEESGTELQVQLATSEGNFNGALVDISDAHYTFVKNSNGTYTISSTTANGQTVYVHHREGDNYPNKASSTEINIAAKSGNVSLFSLQDTTSSNMSNGQYLYFWKSGKLRFDRQSGADDNCYYEFYKKSETAPANSPIAGYAKINSLSDIQNNGEYLIAIQSTSGDYYIMYPTISAVQYAHVAKVTGQQVETAGGETEIAIKAAGEGSTSVKVGDVTYYIIVKNEVKEIDLEVGESTVLLGEITKMDDEQNVVTLAANTDKAPYEKVTELKNGKYLIGTTSHIMVNEPVSVSGDPAGLALRAANFKNGELSEEMWTVTAVTGGYTIQDADGKYLDLTSKDSQNGNVVLSESKQVLRITTETGGAFVIGDGSYYLNNFRGDNDNICGWYQSDAGSVLYFYQSAGTVVTGVNAGETTIVIGGTNYVIKVDSADTPVVTPADKTALVAAIAEAEELSSDDYTEESWNTFTAALNAAKAVNTDADATQEVVNTALADLTAAQEALENKPVDPQPPVEPVNPFEDVYDTDYYYDPVMWAVENGITDGWTPTLFAPEMGCTRGQVVTFLWRAAGEPEVENAENPFTDVAENAYYYDAVLWAVENGITDGWTPDQFAPDMTCTRGQIVTFIWRASGEPTADADENPFTDVAENAYYYDAVLWAVEEGITDGWMPTEFAPEMDCTRGQIVTFLYRYYN